MPHGAVRFLLSLHVAGGGALGRRPPSLFLVGLNTCVPPFTAEADNCHIQRQRGGIGPAGVRGPPGVQKPAPFGN
jgi:hypothetical protein